MNTASASATGAFEIGGKIEPPGLDVGSDQRIEPGLENRDFAAAQGFDLSGILVHAGDLVAEIGKAGAGNQSHIARANHGDTHIIYLLSVDLTNLAECMEFHQARYRCR